MSDTARLEEEIANLSIDGLIVQDIDVNGSYMLPGKSSIVIETDPEDSRIKTAVQAAASLVVPGAPLVKVGRSVVDKAASKFKHLLTKKAGISCTIWVLRADDVYQRRSMMSPYVMATLKMDALDRAKKVAGAYSGRCRSLQAFDCRMEHSVHQQS